MKIAVGLWAIGISACGLISAPRKAPDSNASDATSVDPTDTPDTPPTPTTSSYEVIACPSFSTAAAPEGTCVLDGTGSGLLVIGTLLTPGRVYAPGAVVIAANGGISCVGCDCAAADQPRLTCNGAVVSPGLINAHDHIGWIASPPYVAGDPALRYEHRHDWRKGDAADDEPKISTPGGASETEKLLGELRFVLDGVTSTNASGNSPGLLRNLDQASGLEGLAASPVRYETFPLGDSSGKKLTSGCAYPEIDNPATVAAASAYTPHVAEGIDQAAANEFACLTRDDNGGKRVLSANTAIIHGIGLDAQDVDVLAALGAKLIWSPRSNVSLYGDTAQVTLFHRLGIPIALGTDWLPSGSMNIHRELACASSLNAEHFGGYFTAQDLWRMVTVDAARALGVDDQLGTLAPNKTADVAIFASRGRDPFDAAVQAEAADVLLVLRGGEALVGDSAVVGALRSDCDEVSICGQPRRVCLQPEGGSSYGSLQTAQGSGGYPLFFCGPPDDEPSCVPARTGQGESKNGSTTYSGTPAADDTDGDGIKDGDDICPAVWNPIRPMDLGAQGDADSDGIGDVCDPCPLDNAADCTVPTANPGGGSGGVGGGGGGGGSGGGSGGGGGNGEPGDLSGWTLVQEGSHQEFALPAGTQLTAGGRLVVGRQANAADFATFWGVTLGTEVVYVNADGAMPQINGGETFSLLDADGVVRDGPTLTLTEGNCYARTAPSSSANADSSWSASAATAGNATPGAVTEPVSGVGTYVSEFCDAAGGGNYSYEFLELHFAP